MLAARFDFVQRPAEAFGLHCCVVWPVPTMLSAFKEGRRGKTKLMAEK